MFDPSRAVPGSLEVPTGVGATGPAAEGVPPPQQIQIEGVEVGRRLREPLRRLDGGDAGDAVQPRHRPAAGGVELQLGLDLDLERPRGGLAGRLPRGVRLIASTPDIGLDRRVAQVFGVVGVVQVTGVTGVAGSGVRDGDAVRGPVCGGPLDPRPGGPHLVDLRGIVAAQATGHHVHPVVTSSTRVVNLTGRAVMPDRPRGGLLAPGAVHPEDGSALPRHRSSSVDTVDDQR